jgi:hypothetical protein
LPRCTEGHAQDLVSPRGTQFKGLGFVGLGFRRRGIPWGSDAVGFCEGGEGVRAFLPLEQSLEPHAFPLYLGFARSGT